MSVLLIRVHAVCVEALAGESSAPTARITAARTLGSSHGHSWGRPTVRESAQAAGYRCYVN